MPCTACTYKREKMEKIKENEKTKLELLSK